MNYFPQIPQNGLIATSIDINKDKIVVAVGAGIVMLNAKWNLTSLNDSRNQKNDQVIFPNPATDFITINLSAINRRVNPTIDGNMMIEIYDVMGVLIHSTPFNLTPTLSEGEGVKVDVSNYTPGVYFVKIVGSNGASSIVEMFVKVN